MKFEWVYYEKEIDEKTIDNIVTRGLSKKLGVGEVGGVSENPSSYGVNKKQRKSKINFFDELKDIDIFNRVYKLGMTSNNFNFGFDINQLQAVQFSIYDAKDAGHYDWHTDILWVTDSMFHRKLSVVVQLSDPSEYEGGELQFFNTTFTKQEKKRLQQKGSVIVFPSFIEHRVTPVTKGKRMSLIGWLTGAKFK